MSLLRLTTALSLLLLVTASFAASKDKPKIHPLAPQEIHDLRYGETLYHYFQRKYFSAITDLMVAQARHPIKNQGEDPRLLLGGLYLAYGMQDAAGNLFQQILKNNKLPSAHDQVWYYIAKMRYENGNLLGAEKALLRIKNTLPPDREAESLQMLANIYMAQKKYQKAITILRNFSGDSDWEAYAKFNLGVALVKAGKQQQGMDLLDDVGKLNPYKIDYELDALRDKANLALGYASIRANKPADAIKYFQRIRLVGPLSDKALLGLGWAYTSLKQYKKALTPWVTLQQRNAIDTAVQESMIAIPYVMQKLGKKRLAMSYYDKALRAYTAQIQRLDAVMKAVQGGELIHAMQPANMDDETSLPLSSFGLPDSITAPYLHNMMATNAFQQSYKNLQSLIYLRYVLNHWLAQLPSYELMLSARRKAYYDKLPHVASDQRLQQITEMSKQRDKLAAEIKHIQQTNDGLALVTTSEEDQLKSLAKIKKLLQSLSNSKNLAKAKDEYRVMQGILYFRTQSEFIPRLWQAKSDLIALNKALARTKKTKRDLVKAANDAPKYFQGYDVKITSDRQRIYTLLTGLDTAIREQETQIQKMAMQSLIEDRKQLQSYNVRARFGIARLYDSLVIQKDKKKAHGDAHGQK